MMMVDSRISKWAKVLVRYSLGLKKGDYFLIEGIENGKPLALEVYKEALAAGAHPVIIPYFEEEKELKAKHGTLEQISFEDPLWIFLTEKADAMLTIWAESNPKAYSNIEPAKMSMLSNAREKMMDIYFKRTGDGSLKWCGTQYPTHGVAMDANRSLTEFEEFIFDACLLNTPDPEAAWKKIHESQQKYVEYLSTKSVIEVKSRDTHLTMNVAGRTWVNCDGIVNMPDGEVFTSPIEDSVNGHIRFSYPAIFQSREVVGVELDIENGRIVSAKAEKGEDFLKEMLRTDQGASGFGEFAIGTNYNIVNFTKNILFDEKIGGTIHLAVGAGLPEAGGTNKSAIHWDMICDMKNGGEIYADGELFYKDGKFLI